MQTTLPPYASTLREGWGKVTQKEGIGGLYKGLQPLWGRQIPYTMVKFATFETTVNQIYATLGKPKESYNTLQQTGVSFLGGYIAGVGCAVVSHPADVMVSKLNADRQREYQSLLRNDSWNETWMLTCPQRAKVRGRQWAGSTATSASKASGTACPSESSW